MIRYPESLVPRPARTHRPALRALLARLLSRLFRRDFRLLRIGRLIGHRRLLLLLLRLTGHQLLASGTDVVFQSAADIVWQAPGFHEPAGGFYIGLDVLLGKIWPDCQPCRGSPVPQPRRHRRLRAVPARVRLPARAVAPGKVAVPARPAPVPVGRAARPAIAW